VQEYLRLLLRHSGRPRMRRSLSTSTATTAPPQRGHAPGALCVPTTHSFSAPHSAFTARNAAIFLRLLARSAPASSHPRPHTERGSVLGKEDDDGFIRWWWWWWAHGSASSAYIYSGADKAAAQCESERVFVPVCCCCCLVLLHGWRCWVGSCTWRWMAWRAAWTRGESTQTQSAGG
jgi:hypothetical protein